MVKRRTATLDQPARRVLTLAVVMAAALISRCSSASRT
jgi:hypothetical protein